MNAQQTTTQQTRPKELQKLAHLVERGKHGERDIAASIQQYLQENPEIFDVVGNLTSSVMEQMINHTTHDAYSRMALSHHVEALKTKLAGTQNLDPLESLLVDEVVIAYMLLRASDLLMIRHQSHLTMTDTRKNSQYSARFTRACTALARYRKMGPTIQVNVAQNQINVA